MVRIATSKVIAAAGAALVALGLTSAGTAGPALGRPGRQAQARPSLGGENRPHPETLAEMEAAAAQFDAARGIGAAGADLGTAHLSAFRAAQSMPAALDASLARPWQELGPKPYHADADYGYGCSLDCLWPRTFEQPISSLGWDKVSGRVTALATVPSDATGNRVWVGTAGGGVWYSSDAGAHWTPKFDGQPSLAIGDVAVDPSDPNTVFVGTGEPNTSGDSYFGTGVYRSRDNGATWQRVARNIPDTATVFRIQMAAGRIFVATNKGLFRSTDGGDSYTDVLLPTNAAGTARDAGAFSNFVSDVRVKPGNPNQITAAVGWRRGSVDCEANLVTCARGNGLYRSTNGGAPGSFQRMDTNLGEPGRSDHPLGRISISYATGEGQDHNVMWAVVLDAGLMSAQTFEALDYLGSNALNGIYRSGDDGATWELKATAETLSVAPGSGLTTGPTALYYPGVQTWYNQWIAVDPGNADSVLLGLEEIYQTAANANGAGLAAWKTVGRYWNYCLLAPGPELPTCDKLALYGDKNTTHPDQHAFAFAKTANGIRLYAGNDGGVYRQDPGADGYDNESWTSLNDTLGTTQAYYAVIGGDDTVYAGFQDNGTAKITPDRKGIMVFGGDGFDVAVHPENSDIAFEEYVGGTMYKTLDGGREWRSIAPILTSPLFSTPFEMDPLNPDHLVLVANEIAETSKGADTTCSGDVLQVVAVQHAEQACDWVYSYTLGANPNGGNWQSSAVAVRGAAVYVGICGACNATDVLGGTAKFHNGIATNVGGSAPPETGTDAGWHTIVEPQGLPLRYVSDLAIDPADTKTVYAAVGGYARRWLKPHGADPKVGRGHVFVSHDAGKTWTDLSANLPDSPANAIVVRGDQLVVGTDVGVFVGSKTGGAWTRLGDGLPNGYVWDVNLNPQGTKLVAATHGRGIWLYDFGGAALTRSPAKPKPAVLGGRQTKPGANLPATGAGETVGIGLALIASAAALGCRRGRA